MSTQNTKDPNYDPNITDAETAARQEREEGIKQTPEQEDTINTTSGYTVDQEGRSNNYAIEPEMYIEEPGDLREQKEAEEAERAEERQEIKKQGDKGPGVV